MIFNAELFQGTDDLDQARELFRANISQVEIETHSYCNRRCGYCPNVVGDRLGPNARMPDDIFDRIIRDLKDIDFSGVIVLSNYNEPLADRQIVERIAQTRAHLPKSDIHIYTNGDYLTPDLLEDLAKAGLNYMHISIHMRPDDVYSDVYALERMTEVCARIGRGMKLKGIQAGQMVAGRVPHRTISIDIRAVNYWQLGLDRGGVIEGVARPPERRAACYYPFKNFTIGYTGSVVPCCQMRSDVPQHAKNQIGTIRADEPIYLIYARSAAAAWRRAMVGDRPRGGPCQHCAAGEIAAESAFGQALLKLGQIFPA